MVTCTRKPFGQCSLNRNGHHISEGQYYSIIAIKAFVSLLSTATSSTQILPVLFRNWVIVGVPYETAQITPPIHFKLLLPSCVHTPMIFHEHPFLYHIIPGISWNLCQLSEPNSMPPSSHCVINPAGRDCAFSRTPTALYFVTMSCHFGVLVTFLSI